VARFERGDFLGARLEAGRILAGPVPGGDLHGAGRPPPDLEAAARALLERMAPDRWAVRFGLLVLLLLALVTGLYAR
jgi:hypothetical protein